MNETTIICPSCSTEIKLTESLAAPIVESTRRHYEQLLARQDADLSSRAAALREQEVAIARVKASIDQEVNDKLVAARETVATEEAKRARLSVEHELARQAQHLTDLEALLKERDTKLAEAQKAQADAVRKQRELDDAKREIDLTIETRVQGALAAIRDQARKEIGDEFKLKVLEKEHTISAMQGQIEELRRKAEQGSQQLQGEVQELSLESTLRAKFANDLIEAVPKGAHGGDVLHRVVGPAGQICGTILWESKRTKNWSDGWLSKLRDDQRAARAEIAVIISQAVPKDVSTFDLVEGVWVAEPRCAIPIGLALRQSLIELAATRQANSGQQTKMELVYRYLTGPRFRQRVEAIVEKFADMQDDLEKERRAMTRSWAKRDAQIRGAIEAAAGMYGDFQGIAGSSLSEIGHLELKALKAA
jgi:hypothetical protein